MAKRGILDLLKDGIVLGDGGYVLELERRGYIQAGPYTPEVAIEHPDALGQLHLEFRRAGAQVLQTLTFYASEDKLRTSGHAHEVEDINRAAVKVAKKAAGDDTLVAGVITLTPTFEPDDPNSYRQVRGIFDQQVTLQKEEGVDFIIGETFLNLKEALIALEAIKAAGLVAMITMNFNGSGSPDGFTPEDCAERLTGAGADIIGVNCNYDPTRSLAIAERMRDATGAFIACQPAGYATPDPNVPFVEEDLFPLSLEHIQLTRFAFTGFAEKARDAGINFIGGCCGVLPYHVRAIAEALGRQPEASEKSPDLAHHIIPEVREKDDIRYWREREERTNNEPAHKV